MPQNMGPNMNQGISSPVPDYMQRNSPSPHASTFFNKPQSPPALIIPNSSASNHFPPIVTTSTDGMIGQPQQPTHPGVGMRNMGGSVGLGNSSGGLQPPVDPALKGLTGMDGISPIAPSADGPMIYVQPSTPISALNDGRGHFEAALQRSVQIQNQQNANRQPAYQQQSTSYSGLAQNNQPGNNDQYTQNLGQANVDGSIDPGMYNQQSDQWMHNGQTGWDNLRPLNIGRPRAKSDSYMVSPVADPSFSRQAVFDALAGLGTNGAQPVNDDQMRNAIDQWRNTGMFGNTNNGQPPQTATMDPRTLPGQDNTAESLNQFNLSQQLSALQAQRDRRPSVDTANQGQMSGKTEVGQISPTSMAFYRQLGMNPLQASQLPGTVSAPFYQSTFENIPQGQYPQTAAPGANFLTPDIPGMGSRRRSFAEGSSHPAAGAGTPGYGVEFAQSSSFGSLGPGRIRGVGGGSGGHRRDVKSEDWGRGGDTGWGVGLGGST